MMTYEKNNSKQTYIVLTSINVDINLCDPIKCCTARKARITK